MIDQRIKKKENVKSVSSRLLIDRLKASNTTLSLSHGIEQPPSLLRHYIRPLSYQSVVRSVSPWPSATPSHFTGLHLDI